MTKKSKLLFSLGSVALVATPLVGFVSCGNKETDEQKQARLEAEIKIAVKEDKTSEKTAKLIKEWSELILKRLVDLTKEGNQAKIEAFSKAVVDFSAEIGISAPNQQP